MAVFFSNGYCIFHLPILFLVDYLHTLLENYALYYNARRIVISEKEKACYGSGKGKYSFSYCWQHFLQFFKKYMDNGYLSSCTLMSYTFSCKAQILVKKHLPHPTPSETIIVYSLYQGCQT